MVTTRASDVANLSPVWRIVRFVTVCFIKQTFVFCPFPMHHRLETELTDEAIQLVNKWSYSLPLESEIDLVVRRHEWACRIARYVAQYISVEM
jgi:hypothetical protein